MSFYTRAVRDGFRKSFSRFGGKRAKKQKTLNAPRKRKGGGGGREMRVTEESQMKVKTIKNKNKRKGEQ